MRLHLIEFIFFVAVFFGISTGYGFENKKFAIGAAYYSQNILNAVSAKDTGATSFLGETYYPLNLRYEMSFKTNWFFAPQLSYTVLPRKTSDDMAKLTFTHLVFSFGKDFSGRGRADWDWSVGPGLMRYDTKGNGGTTELSNGTGTATFAVPGRTTTVQKITTVVGSSYSLGPSRFGVDLIIENLFSSTKRAESLMLSYAYRFSGGL